MGQVGFDQAISNFDSLIENYGFLIIDSSAESQI